MWTRASLRRLRTTTRQKVCVCAHFLLSDTHKGGPSVQFPWRRQPGPLNLLNASAPRTGDDERSVFPAGGWIGGENRTTGWGWGKLLLALSVVGVNYHRKSRRCMSLVGAGGGSFSLIRCGRGWFKLKPANHLTRIIIMRGAAHWLPYRSHTSPEQQGYMWKPFGCHPVPSLSGYS